MPSGEKTYCPPNQLIVAQLEMFWFQRLTGVMFRVAAVGFLQAAGGGFHPSSRPGFAGDNRRHPRHAQQANSDRCCSLENVYSECRT